MFIMKKIIQLVVALLFFCNAMAQDNAYHCYPANWWTGMKYSNIQLMLYGGAIANAKGGISINYPGVKVTKVHKVESRNYLFVDLNISATAKPGKIKIKVLRENWPFDIDFELKARKTKINPVNSSDLIYLVMPDRFANGDPGNDKMDNMREIVNSRDSLKGRHGGDIQGITKHLDYLQELGVTALWLNPVIINDMVRESFHGYAFTNHYQIEPRLGGERAYHEMIDALHARKMKVVQDAVYNHVGIHHFTVADKPMKDWLNEWQQYTNTSYKDQVLFDPCCMHS